MSVDGAAALEIVSVDGRLVAFDSWVPKIEEWEGLAANIVVAGPEDKATMGIARESRLGLRRVRLEIEKRRKELKEDSLRRGQMIDKAAKALEDRIAPLEAKLLEAEETGARHEAKQAAERLNARLSELKTVDSTIDWLLMFPNDTLGKMEDSVYGMALDGVKAGAERKREDARKAADALLAKEKAEAEEREARRREAALREEERQAREKAQAEENARLRREAAEREAAAKKEREAVEAERAKERAEAERQRQADLAAQRQQDEARRAQEAAEREKAELAARKEREALERRVKEEREAREAAEAVLRKQKEEAAAKAKAEAAEAKRRAAAPDKDKLFDWAEILLMAMETLPAMATPEGAAARMRIRQRLDEVDDFVRAQANGLVEL